MKHSRLKAYFFLLITVIIWGAAGNVIKFTLDGIPPFPFLAYRFAISGVMAALILFISQGPSLGLKHKIIRNNLPVIILYGLFATTFALSVLFVGLENSTILDLAIITIMSPLLIEIGGAIFFKDRITKREKIGTLIVFFGVLVTEALPLLGLNGESARYLSGSLFLFAFLFFDVSSVLIAKYLSRRKVPENITTNYTFLIAALTLIPFAFYQNKGNFVPQIVSLEPQYHLGVLYMAILSGLIAYYFWLKGQKSIEVSEASLFYYLQPLIGVPLAVFWLGEKITPHFIVGAVVIVIGLIIAEKK